MTISIIIAVKTCVKRLEECIAKCRELDYPDFEILVLPDNPLQGLIPPKGTVPMKIIPTGPVSPGKKRDIALKYAQGETLAFIDDDAYPDKNWLKNAVRNFNGPQVAAVGGPAVTPPEDNLREKASGLIYSSLLVSGQYSYRYLAGKKQEVDDYPSCNFLVRKSVMQELGGFQTDFWPGEDTKLCLDITKKLKKKIIYDPEVLVYHHRRALFLPHLKQVASYALHRGYFIKRYPGTSLRVSYFVPSIFLLFLLGGWFIYPLRAVYPAGLPLYLLLVFLFSTGKNVNRDSSPRRGLSLKIFVFSGIILTHLTYGWYFLKGLLAKKLKEE